MSNNEIRCDGCRIHPADQPTPRAPEPDRLICKCGARRDGSVGHDPAVHAAYGQFDVWGACGVPRCLRCRPLYDADNNPIAGTE